MPWAAPLAFMLAAFWAVGVLAQPGVGTFRVAVWNVETIGSPGSGEYGAALAVIGRLGADAVAINEVLGAGDVGSFHSLAAAAGYPHVIVPDSNPFGSMRNAIMSKRPFLFSHAYTASDAAGVSANDITRYFIRADVALPDRPEPITIITQHFKSGSANSDEFRRAVESIRIASVVSRLGSTTGMFIVCGDFNEDVSASPSPVFFTGLPSGLPGSFNLGSDLASQMPAPGLRNHPFFPLISLGMTVLDSRQPDGSRVTRPSSGRRLDYILVSPLLSAQGVLGEVYDSNDEALAGLPKFGPALPASTCATAADHLPVFADASLPYVCYADCDSSGLLDLFDVLCYLNIFTAGAHWSDCDEDGGRDLFDVLCFLQAFQVGCE